MSRVELIGVYGDDKTHALSAWTSTSRDLTPEKEARIPVLLEALAREGHLTPFEKSSLHFLVTVDQATHIHLLKHRVGVSCVSGDTEIHIYKKGGGVDKRKISDMYEAQEFGIETYSKSGKSYRRIYGRYPKVRSFDSDTNLIVGCSVNRVFYNGQRMTYRFTMSDGKHIDCTSDHRFYVEGVGWSEIGSAIGLEVRDGIAGMTKHKVKVAVNGVMDRPWVEKSFFHTVEGKMTRVQAAKHLGMKYENLKKWGYVHGINFLVDESKDFKKGGTPWNSGFKGYKATRAKKGLRAITKDKVYKSEKVWRSAVGNWTREQLPLLLKKYNYVCQGPGEVHSRDFECHHIIPVMVDHSRACDFDNLILVCSDCHKSIHKTMQSTSEFEAKLRSRTEPIKMALLKPRKGRMLQAHYVEVVSVECLGVQDVYDLSVDETHNYVANGIIIHNCNAESARYKELKEDKTYLPADWIGKSVAESVWFDDDGSPYLAGRADWHTILREYTDLGNKLYHRALAELTPQLGRKRAKETARYFKTMNSMITMDVMFNWRSFMHFVKLRVSNDAQFEVRELGERMLFLVDNIPSRPFRHSLKAFGYGGE